MKLSIQNPTLSLFQSHTVNSETFVGCKLALSWEAWHQCFGHVGYSGLQKLLDEKLDNGFNIDDWMLKPNYVACTKAKQHVEPFAKASTRRSKPGELTHIDLWGKYSIKSINGNQYYLLFVNDTKRYVTVKFLKEKSEAAQGVINYLTHLITHGKTPKAIQIDGEKEFVNQKLETWCKDKDIEI
jgi:hypothetical protein